jgi:hypothetical protein
MERVNAVILRGYTRDASQECWRLDLWDMTCVSTAKQYCQHFILPTSRFRNIHNLDSETSPALNTNRGAMIE